jgi:GDP-4-dehydro-6-deoxy-D-mannose reductase
MTDDKSLEGKNKQEEDAPLVELALSEAKPTNPYAVSKFEMEKIIENRFNDRVIRARPFPHIGPGQGRGFVTADFAAQIAAVEKGKEVPVVKVGNLNTSREGCSQCLQAIDGERFSG